MAGDRQPACTGDFELYLPAGDVLAAHCLPTGGLLCRALALRHGLRLLAAPGGAVSLVDFAGCPGKLPRPSGFERGDRRCRPISGGPVRCQEPQNFPAVARLARAAQRSDFKYLPPLAEGQLECICKSTKVSEKHPLGMSP